MIYNLRACSLTSVVWACGYILSIFNFSVDGQWNAWTLWSECQTSCGSKAAFITGTSYRSRVCNNPKPANEGLHCKGNPIELMSCVPSGKLSVY